MVHARFDPRLLRSLVRVDTRNKTQRSRIMSAVRTRDTGPELAVRKLLTAQGYRYRLHRGDLPGRPDIVFPGGRKVVFVHGCFWHGHSCAKGRLPKSRLLYWRPKIMQNKSRDGRNVRALRRSGWRVVTVWQCQLKDLEAVATKLRRFIEIP